MMTRIWLLAIAFLSSNYCFAQFFEQQDSTIELAPDKVLSGITHFDFSFSVSGSFMEHEFFENKDYLAMKWQPQFNPKVSFHMYRVSKNNKWFLMSKLNYQRISYAFNYTYLTKEIKYGQITGVNNFGLDIGFKYELGNRLQFGYAASTEYFNGGKSDRTAFTDRVGLTNSGQLDWKNKFGIGSNAEISYRKYEITYHLGANWPFGIFKPVQARNDGPNANFYILDKFYTASMFHYYLGLSYRFK